MKEQTINIHACWTRDGQTVLHWQDPDDTLERQTVPVSLTESPEVFRFMHLVLAAQSLRLRPTCPSCFNSFAGRIIKSNVRQCGPSKEQEASLLPY